MRELQWQCYNKHQLTAYNMGDILVYKYGVEDQPKPDQTPLVYFATDVPTTAFDCDSCLLYTSRKLWNII